MGRLTAALQARIRADRYPLHGEEAYAPFFIVGAGRSGTTLLRRILQASPEVHIPPETYMVGKAVQIFSKYQNLGWNDMTHLIMAQFEFHPDFGHFGISLRPLVQRLKKAKGKDRNLAFLLDALYRYHGEQSGKICARWGDKTPYHSLFMPEIEAVFPDVRFVHMLRDGADSVVSYVKGELQADLHTAAQRWTEYVDAVARYAEKNPARVYLLRYEDLVIRPTEVIEPLCVFLGLKYETGMLARTDHAAGMGDVANLKHLKNVMNPISASSIGKGRCSLSMEDRRVLQQLIGPQLARYGYEPLD